jgi:predicted ATPase
MNLFVGENNSGKSCLLEAVNLYAGMAPVTDILQTAAGRSADRPRSWDPVSLTEEGTSLRHPVFDLFHRAGPLGPKGPILIGTTEDPKPLRVELRLHRTVVDEEGRERYIPALLGDVTSEPAELALPVYRGDRQVGLVTRYSRPLRGYTPDLGKMLSEDARTVAFLPASGFADEEAGRLRARLALLKVEGEGRLPLRSMGDGLTKLFHIALAAASAPQGVLLIDEFENGLHWSVQEKLWKALARAARDFNVQVFSTTHSRDCIESFAAAAIDAGPDGASIYRLERKGDDVIATDLPLLNVDAAMREHQEVR